MRIEQLVLDGTLDAAGMTAALAPLAAGKTSWLLVFGHLSFFADGARAASWRTQFPATVTLGCSTAGEIGPAGVSDGRCIVTAVWFSKVHPTAAQTTLETMDDSFAAGERLGAQLCADGVPRAVMVLGPGVAINGTALVDGMASVLGQAVPITGGLAGDGGAFERTWTLGPHGVGERIVAAVGFRGEGLRHAHGSFGGWQPFGPARKVTRCDGNVLFELDGEPALAIYKKYLGEYASQLPASGLLFPFAMLGSDQRGDGLIRTILGVDEAAGSLTLAGAIESGGYLKLMHASTDRLIDGAEAAADATQAMAPVAGAGHLAVLVSCVGRKLVMGDRVDEEVEAVAEVLGRGTRRTGFYSYGEISPSAPGVGCRLHNQTMTITRIGEA